MSEDEGGSTKHLTRYWPDDGKKRRHDSSDVKRDRRERNDRESRGEKSRRPQSSVVRVPDRERRQRSPSSEGEIRSEEDEVHEVSRRKRRSYSSDRDRPERYWRNKRRSRSPPRRRSRSRDRERPRRRSRSNDKENSTRGDRRRGGKETEEQSTDKESGAKAAEPAETAEATKMTSQAKAMKDMLTTKTGGAYIPPAKLRMMQQQITDKNSMPYQRLAWEALKKSITGLVNKVNKGNLGIIVRELFKENIVRGRGLLSRCIIQAQSSSPTFTHIYAALVSVINCKFPKVGELLLRRLVIQFRRGFRRNDKALCISSVKFIAHLVNQCVAHEILALEILTLLVENPTDDSVEVAIAFLKECGDKLTEVSSKALHSIFEMLRNILHEGALDKRVQYMIEVMFQVRKDGFKDHKAVEEGLDVVEEEDQFTHLITLDEATDPQDVLNVFKFDPEFEANEEKYAQLRKELLDEDTDDGDSGEDGSEGDSDDSDESEKEEDEAAKQTIIDNTETNLIALRRTIYLTITSSLDFEECAHKLLRMSLKPGQESQLCHMFLDCCAQQRTYEKFYGLLAQRFCQMNKIYIAPFEKIFQDTYSTVHRLETKMLRNVAKFFGHLLFTDAISWGVLNCVRLTEEDTNSSSRIFIKILFQELSEYMGLQKLNDRVKDPTLQTAFEGLFPRDNPKNTRFAINFFTSIGLGGLTDELREHLKAQPKAPVVPALVQALPSSSSSSSSSESSSSSSSSSSSDSSSDEDSEPQSKRKRKKKLKKKPSKKAKKQKPEKKSKKSRK